MFAERTPVFDPDDKLKGILKKLYLQGHQTEVLRIIEKLRKTLPEMLTFYKELRDGAAKGEIHIKAEAEEFRVQIEASCAPAPAQSQRQALALSNGTRCQLLAQNGHAVVSRRCPLLAVKPTSRFYEYTPFCNLSEDSHTLCPLGARPITASSDLGGASDHALQWLPRGF
jgi:hypothetical protein